MTPSDARARFKRMQGCNVRFRLALMRLVCRLKTRPSRTTRIPKIWTYDNIERMRAVKHGRDVRLAAQKRSRSIPNTKWTQWFFKRLYMMGLAYRDYASVDFCPSCNTTWPVNRFGVTIGIASAVVRRSSKETGSVVFRTTDYAENCWISAILTGRNASKRCRPTGSGRSEGAEVVFKTEQGHDMPIFTTRPDTL